jgi:hypothetical protein
MDDAGRSSLFVADGQCLSLARHHQGQRLLERGIGRDRLTLGLSIRTHAFRDARHGEHPDREIGAAHELPHEIICRIREDLGRARILDELAGAHHGDAVA